MGTGDDFLTRTPIAEELRVSVDKMGLYHIKKLLHTKKPPTILRVKTQSIKWEKIFASHSSDKGLVSRIFKELEYETPEEQIIYLINGKINLTVFKREVQISSKYMKKYSTPLAKGKASQYYIEIPSHPSQNGNHQVKKTTNAGEDIGKRNPHTVVVGV
jgi:hypothetical protein